jgi:hypothetical protein
VEKSKDPIGWTPLKREKYQKIILHQDIYEKSKSMKRKGHISWYSSLAINERVGAK